MKATRARLDADRSAKPLTEIVAHARRGDCVGPWTHPDTYRETAEARGSHVHLCKIAGDCGIVIVRSEWVEPT